jgi:hypothetical protein
MPAFIFSYRSAKDYDAAADPDGLAAWGAFISEVIAPNVVDPGWPVFEPAAVLGGAGREAAASRSPCSPPCPPSTRRSKSAHACPGPRAAGPWRANGTEATPTRRPGP